MPVIKSMTIERLTAKEAYTRGYMTLSECNDTRKAFIDEDWKQSIYKQLVYIDGIYVGVCNNTDKLYQVLEKFKIS